MRQVLAYLCVITLSHISHATAQQFSLNGSLGSGAGRLRAAISGQLHTTVGSRLRLGAGLRLSSYTGETASFRSVGGETSSFPTNVALEPAVWSLNLMLEVQARIVGGLAAGANLDLAGVAWGPGREQASAALKPTRGSLFQYGDRDRGSLNSEFFLAFPIGRRIEMRGGASHYVVGYSATAAAGTARYLRFETVPMIAVRWRP